MNQTETHNIMIVHLFIQSNSNRVHTVCLYKSAEKLLFFFLYLGMGGRVDDE